MTIKNIKERFIRMNILSKIFIFAFLLFLISITHLGHIIFLISTVSCIGIVLYINSLNSKSKKMFPIAGLILYCFIGLTNCENVKEACTHGNCEHGWNSEYNKSEKTFAFFWSLSPFLILVYSIDKEEKNAKKDS